MKNMQMTFRFIFLAILTCTLLACTGTETGPQAWIDFPSNGSNFPDGQAVKVVSHAFSKAGLAEFVLLVNGTAYRRDVPENPGEALGRVSQEWIPSGEGTFSLQVAAYLADGSSINSAPVAVTIGERPPLIEVSPEVSPVELPDLAIVSVQAIVVGEKDGVPFCHTRVEFTNQGSAPVPSDFAIQFFFYATPEMENIVAGGLAPGANQEIIFTYEWDRSDGTPYIGINLDSTNLIFEEDEGNNTLTNAYACVTPVTVTPTLEPTVTHPIPSITPTTPPPPPGDREPPSTPVPAVPADGLEIGCKSSQNLVWMPSQDVSGIAKYELQVERRATVNDSWKRVDEWNNIKDKQHTIPVACGYTYRWRVRALDKAGNFSAWSGWSLFTLLIQ